MYTEAKSPVPWDLADKKTQKNRFVSRSFYIVVDGANSDAVRSTCTLLKQYFARHEGVRVRGPKAMQTERRRYMLMRELKTPTSPRGTYITRPKRYRNVLLVVHPSAVAIAGLTSLVLPSEVNVAIEDYANQYELREDR